MDSFSANQQLFARIAALLDAMEQALPKRAYWESLLFDAYRALQDLPPDLASRLDWYVWVLAEATMGGWDLSFFAAELTRRRADGEPLTDGDLPSVVDVDTTRHFALRGIRALLPASTIASELPTERPYRFVVEPCGEALDELFSLARATCALFVLRHPNYAQGSVPSVLEPFRLRRDSPCDRPHVVERDGGRSYWFRFDDESARALRSSIEGFYARLDGLEDLSFRRPTGLPWAVASTHERDGDIYLRREERVLLAEVAPSLDACLATDPIFD